MNASDKLKKRVTIFVPHELMRQVRGVAIEENTSVSEMLTIALNAIAQKKIMFVGRNVLLDTKVIKLDPLIVDPEQRDPNEKAIYTDEDGIEHDAFEEFRRDTSSYPNITFEKYCTLEPYLVQCHKWEFEEDKWCAMKAQEFAVQLNVNKDSVIRALKRFPLYKEHPGFEVMRQALGVLPPRRGMQASDPQTEI